MPEEMIMIRTRARKNNSLTRLNLELLEDRLAPAAYTVNDSSDLDAANAKKSAQTANGTITLRSIFDRANAVGGSYDISFQGPMDITLSISNSLGYFKGPMTINGISGANGPEVTIHGGLMLGSGNNLHDLYITDSQSDGLFCQNGNTIKNDVFSGNAGDGISACGSGNKITGNIVGLTPDGKSAQPNGQNGIFVFGSSNIVGGTSSADRNFISANTFNGINILSSTPPFNAAFNKIMGNWIGVTQDGSTALPNKMWGVTFQGVSNIIGGTTTGAGNLIVSASGGQGGIQLTSAFPSSDGNKIQGNLIGTKADGNSMFTPEANDPGSSVGVYINSGGKVTNTIVQNNVIADSDSGIQIGGGNGPLTGTQIVGNKIGVGQDGSTELRNGDGIDLLGADGITIGGTSEANKNIIGGSFKYGITLDQGSNKNQIVANYIGTNASDADLGNGVHGVYIINGSNNRIGCVSDGKAPNNVIAHNGFDPFSKMDTKNERGNAIQIDQGNGNIIRLNSIYENKALAIALQDPTNPNTVPQNDCGLMNAKGQLTVMPNGSSRSLSGPNHLQNYPVVKSIQGSNITWEIDSTPKTTFTLDFYGDEQVYDLGYGQGKTPFTTITVTTDAAGHAEHTVSFGSSQHICATASGSNGTSAMSIVDSSGDGIADGWKDKGGIDYNMDGTVDDPGDLADAVVGQRDVFIRANTTADSLGAGVDTVTIGGALHTVFAANGINLHFSWGASTLAGNVSNLASALQGGRTADFGTGLSSDGLKAREMVYRWVEFVKGFTNPANGATHETGASEVGTLNVGGKLEPFAGDTAVIAVNAGQNTASTDVRDYEGTLMHELGHTFGLSHGGSDDVQFKPNDYTVMNYLWQMPDALQKAGFSVSGDYANSWTLDYSHGTSPSINEANGRAAITIAGPAGKMVPVFNGYEFNLFGVTSVNVTPGESQWRLVPFNTPFTPLPAGRWNATGRVDLNGDGKVGVLNGSINEWAQLVLNFRESPTYGSTFGSPDAGFIAPPPGGPRGVDVKTDLVVGSDAGSPPGVQVFAPDGSIAYDFAPFASNFTGGVRVAKGDVNGDGVPDFITAMGPAVGGIGGDTVNIYDGSNGTLMKTLTPFGVGFSGGINVAVGDVNGDGHNDLIFTPASGLGSTILVLSGVDYSVLQTFSAYASTFKGGVNVAAGDVNGDGKADIVVAPASGASPLVKVFSGATQGMLLSSFTEGSPAYNGAYVAVADINGDGRADIITGAGAGTSKNSVAEVLIHSGKSPGTILGAILAADPTFKGGVRVGAVQLVDGSYDIVTSTGTGQAPLVRRFNSLTHQESWETSPFDNTFNGAFVG
jgi:hypothetical protein